MNVDIFDKEEQMHKLMKWIVNIVSDYFIPQCDECPVRALNRVDKVV